MLAKDTEQSIDARPSQFSARQAAPRPKRRINAKTVLIATGAFSVLSAAALIMAFSGSLTPVKAPASSKYGAVPIAAVTDLPGDYAELARRQPKAKQELVPQQAVQAAQLDLSAEEKYLAELRLARLKRALEARQSEVAFSKTTMNSGGSGAGGSISQLGSQSALLPQLGLEGAEGAAAGLNPRDLDGRQDEKRAFLEKIRNDNTTLLQPIKPLLSPYQVMAGTVIPGLLLTGINSDLPGQILGQVSQAVFDSESGSTLLVPQGTKILGTYDSRVVYGQERVLVVWTRLIFPNGRSINLEGMAGVDLSGYAGLSDRVNNHYLKLLTGVVLGSVLGAAAQIAEGGTSTVDPSFSQLAAQGMARNINEAGQQITRKNLNIQPTLEISPGFRFNVFVTKDIVLEPYEG